MDSTVEMILVIEARESLSQGVHMGYLPLMLTLCLLCGGRGEDEMALPSPLTSCWPCWHRCK